MRKMMLIGAVVACAVALPATAKDRSGYVSIAAGSLSEAERTLNAERAIFPDRPELMLNLAAVYRRTGRTAEARTLYMRVLERRPIAMDLPSGAVASSHDLARRALGTNSVQIATR